MALTPEELESQIALQDRLNESIARNVELKRQLNKTTETQSEVQANFFSMFDDNVKSTENATSGQQDLAGALDEVANSQKEVGDSTSFTDKAMMFLNKTVMSAQAGFRSLMGVLKPLYSFIMLNPVFEILGDNLQNVRAAQQGAFEAAQQFKETLGTLPATINKFNQFVEASGRTLAKTGRSLSSIAGIEYGDITKKFLGYASEMGIGFDHFVDHAKNAAGEIILFKEGLQMSIDTLEDLTFRFGEDSFGDFAKQIVGGSDKLGLSLQNVSKNFQAGIKDAGSFGYMTRKELSATSLFATKLGMEMSELTSFADGFDTFEGAAEKVGKLSAAFGIQLDTMDLVMEDNPAKKLDMVREALEKSGQSMDNILGDRRQAKYLADTLGLPIEQLEKLSSLSTDEFGFSDAFDAAAESQEELTEMDALKTISDQMRDLNNALNPMTNSAKTFFGSFIQGFQTAAEKGGIFKELTVAFKGPLDKFFAVGSKVYNLVSDLFKAGDKAGEGAGPLRGMVEPFFTYFKQMSDVADKLIGDKKNPGILTKVFDGIKAFLSGDDDAFKETGNIFTMLFEPFKDVDKPSIFTEGIQKGLIRLAELTMSSLAQAFRFVGSEATNWVAALFERSKDTVAGDAEPKSKLMEFGKEIFKAIGDMLSGLAEAATGLSAFLVGGTFQGVNYSYEDSVFGKMFSETDESGKISSGFSDLAGNLASAIAHVFGSDELANVFDSGGVGMGDKFAVVMTKVKSSFVKTLGEFVTELADFGATSALQMEKEDGFFDVLTINPSYRIMKMLSGMKPLGNALMTKAVSLEAAAKAQAEEIERLSKVHRNAVMDAARAERVNAFAAMDIDIRTEQEIRQAKADAAATDIAEKLDPTNYVNPLLSSLEEPIYDGTVNVADFMTQGLADGVKEKEAEVFDIMTVFGNKTIDATNAAVGNESPSKKFYEIGQYMVDGLMAGFFGDEKLVQGSGAKGFVNRFEKRMIQVQQDIEKQYQDISNSAVVAIEQKLGRVGQILSGEKPLAVVVDNKKLQIAIALDVKMDSHTVATSIANAPGGSYFYVNAQRKDDGTDEFKVLESTGGTLP